jgi:hypothetical protein
MLQAGLFRRRHLLTGVPFGFGLVAVHARVHVAHTQQWCVDAHAVEEARELRSAGAGYRCAIGDCVNIEVLHPLEYVAMNALTAGTRGAYDKFELDYWSAAATEAVRRLEHRLDYDPSIRLAETPPSVLVCIGSRKERVHPILRRPWIVETDPD